MTAMAQEMSWDSVARREGDAIIELSSVDVEDVSGGIPWRQIGIVIDILFQLLWPEEAE